MERFRDDWGAKLLWTVWLAILAFWVLPTALAMVKHNLASVFVNRSLTETAGQDKSSCLFNGHYDVHDQASLKNALTLWGDRTGNRRSYLYGLALYMQGNYTEVVAEIKIKQNVNLYPTEALLLGQALFALGRTLEAGDVWREAGIDLPLRFLAAQSLRRGDFESTLPLYQRLSVIWPQEGEIQRQLGEIYRNLPEPDSERAVAAYRRAAELGQDVDQMHLLIIITELAATRDSAEARAQLETMLARPDLAVGNRITALRVMYNIYRYYYNDLERAESYLLTAVELPRNEGDIWEESQLVQLYLISADCEAARRWYVAVKLRYREGISPLDQFEQLKQEVARVCKQ